MLHDIRLPGCPLAPAMRTSSSHSFRTAQMLAVSAGASALTACRSRGSAPSKVRRAPYPASAISNPAASCGPKTGVRTWSRVPSYRCCGQCDKGHLKRPTLHPSCKSTATCTPDACQRWLVDNAAILFDVHEKICDQTLLHHPA